MTLNIRMVTFTPQQPIAVEADKLSTNPPGQILSRHRTGRMRHNTNTDQRIAHNSFTVVAD